jgi:hypothetical protein
MKIAFTQDQIDFLKETLVEVDSRAYDPVYKNTVDRVALSSVEEFDKNGVAKTVQKVVVEEFEVFTLIEALQERSEHMSTSDEVKAQCNDLLEFINENTGLSL